MKHTDDDEELVFAPEEDDAQAPPVRRDTDRETRIARLASMSVLSVPVQGGEAFGLYILFDIIFGTRFYFSHHIPPSKEPLRMDRSSL